MKVENLTKSFGSSTILKNFSMEFKENKITCILGKSGCGKTTLLNLICGLDKPDSGEILFKIKNPEFSYLFQEPRLFPWLNVLENVCATLKENKKTAHDYLCQVGLEASLNKYPNELSGGMRQRVAIARAFSKKSDIILLDEPFQSLDLALHDCLRKQFLSLWEQSKSTVIWVTHDINEACLSADEIVCLGSIPVTIKTNYTIETPRQNRSLEEMSKIASKLYKILTEQ